MSGATAWIPLGPALLFCPADRQERYEELLEATLALA